MLGLKREIDQVAKDKGLDSKEIIAALEEAMRQAAKRERGLETEIDARFNEELGEIELFEFRQVVEQVTDKNAHISLDDAKAYDPDAEIGDEIGVKVDTSSFGRILAQTAKQVIIQRIREAERDTVYEEYKDRAHEIVNGIVRRFEKGAIIVDLGRAEAVIPPKEQVPRENYRPNDRVRAYVLEVKKTAKGPQIMLSRAHGGFNDRFRLTGPTGHSQGDTVHDVGRRNRDGVVRRVRCDDLPPRKARRSTGDTCHSVAATIAIAAAHREKRGSNPMPVPASAAQVTPRDYYG